MTYLVKKGTIEKHQFKITIAVAVLVLLFIMTTTFTVATWKSNIESDYKGLCDEVNHISEKFIAIRIDIDELSDKANNRDIQLTEIQVKLVNIESLLLEVKQDIKDNR